MDYSKGLLIFALAAFLPSALSLIQDQALYYVPYDQPVQNYPQAFQPELISESEVPDLSRDKRTLEVAPVEQVQNNKESEVAPEQDTAQSADTSPLLSALGLRKKRSFCRVCGGGGYGHGGGGKGFGGGGLIGGGFIGGGFIGGLGGFGGGGGRGFGGGHGGGGYGGGGHGGYGGGGHGGGGWGGRPYGGGGCGGGCGGGGYGGGGGSYAYSQSSSSAGAGHWGK